jgi:hypothetical protein
MQRNVSVRKKLLKPGIINNVMKNYVFSSHIPAGPSIEQHFYILEFTVVICRM